MLTAVDPLTIAVINTKKAGRTGEYVGRKCGDDEESPLHNPFTLPRGAPNSARIQVIQRFKQHLDEAIARVAEGGGSTKDWLMCQELDRLLAIARKGNLKLRCWCKPKDCRGDVIREVLLEAIETGQIFCPDVKEFQVAQTTKSNLDHGKDLGTKPGIKPNSEGPSRRAHRYGSCSSCGGPWEIPGLEKSKCSGCGWQDTVKRKFEVKR